MATPRVCSIEGCRNTYRVKRGLCNMHYLRWRRHGAATAGRTPNGEQQAYMLAHMWDDCPKWPFTRDRKGYARINYGGHSAKLVHQAVCELAHGPAPTSAHEVAHSCGKGNQGCFGASCLSWKTHLENVGDSIAHGTWSHGETVVFAKLTEEQVREIRRLQPDGKLWARAREVAQKFGVCGETVINIWRRKTWAWME